MNCLFAFIIKANNILMAHQMSSTLSWISSNIGYYLGSTTSTVSASTDTTSTTPIIPVGTADFVVVPTLTPLPPNIEMVKEINSLEIPDRSNIKFPKALAITQTTRRDFLVKELESMRSKLKPTPKVDRESVKPLTEMQIMLKKIKETMASRRFSIVGISNQ
jgi:hypothetical protein